MDNGQASASKAEISRVRAGRWIAVAGPLALLTPACATPYDLPVPTMVGSERAYSMMGFVSTGDEEKVKAKVLRIMRTVCPSGARLVQFRTERADSAMMKILRYEAVGTCDPARGGR